MTVKPLVGKGSSIDPRGLISESYKIDGITIEECRSIFLDWAMSVPSDQDVHPAIRSLIAAFGDELPDHPMTQVLREGVVPTGPARRKGGARRRSRA